VKACLVTHATRRFSNPGCPPQEVGKTQTTRSGYLREARGHSHRTASSSGREWPPVRVDYNRARHEIRVGYTIPYIYSLSEIAGGAGTNLTDRKLA
jgi:hypothetical protein